MQTGTLEQSHKIVILGIALSGPLQIHVPAKNLRATLDYEKAFILRTEIKNITERVGSNLAARTAQEVYERLLMEFGGDVYLSVEPEVMDSHFTPKTRFTPKNSSSVRQPKSGKLQTKGLAPRRIITLGPEKFEALAREVEMRLATPQPPTSAQLYTAIKMFSVGMQSDDKVVRFLILYGAITIVALFKYHYGSQNRVDQMVRNVNTTLPMFRVKNREPETLYSKLRNDFIHAEDRGCDPTGAMRAIEQHIGQFQRDVALLFKSL